MKSILQPTAFFILLAFSATSHAEPNLLFKISTDSLFTKSKDGFEEKEIDSWQKEMDIFYVNGHYYYETKNIPLEVSGEGKNLLILIQHFPMNTGIRVFTFFKETKSATVTEISYLHIKKEQYYAGDFSGVPWVYYGTYDIEFVTDNQ